MEAEDDTQIFKSAGFLSMRWMKDRKRRAKSQKMTIDRERASERPDYLLIGKVILPFSCGGISGKSSEAKTLVILGVIVSAICF